MYDRMKKLLCRVKKKQEYNSNQVEEVRFTFILYLVFCTLGKYEQQFNFLEFFDR